MAATERTSVVPANWRRAARRRAGQHDSAAALTHARPDSGSYRTADPADHCRRGLHKRHGRRGQTLGHIHPRRGSAGDHRDMNAVATLSSVFAETPV